MWTRRKLLRASLAAPALILPSRGLITPVRAWTHGSSQFPVPAVAAANGLNTQTFFDDFNSSSTIDLSKTGNPGFNWYLNTAWPNAYQPFGGYLPVTTGTPCSASDISVANSAITLQNGIPQSEACGFNLQTAQAAGASYVGQGFTPPMYVEWKMKINNFGHDDAEWPAVWTTAIDWLTGSAHAFLEMDGVEYIGHDPGVTDMFCHYWNFDTQTDTEPGGATIIPGIADTNYHVMGFLWLPANGAVDGSITRYFDGVHQAAADFSYASGSQGAASDTFKNMLIIISGSDDTVSWDYVGVWT